MMFPLKSPILMRLYLWPYVSILKDHGATYKDDTISWGICIDNHLKMTKSNI